MHVPDPGTIAIPLDLIAIIRELAHDARKDSDGGVKITISEGEAIAGRLADLADHIARAVAGARG